MPMQERNTASSPKNAESWATMRWLVMVRGQLLTVFDRQGAEHDRVQQAEDGGVGANAQRERGERDDGNPGMAQQGAGSVRDVLGKALEPIPSQLAGIVKLCQFRPVGNWLSSKASPHSNM